MAVFHDIKENLLTDVAIVGAGPAGTSAAKAIADANLSVIVIEKKSEIGTPVHCAGFIPKQLLLSVNAKPSIAQEVKSMRTYLPGGETVDIRSPGFIVDRGVFDRLLGREAIHAGASILTGTTALSMEKDSLFVKTGDDVIKISAKVIIGADGPKSMVGRCANERNRDYIIAHQVEVPLNETMDRTEIYFDREIRSGYGWLFPKGDTANVGIGVNYKHSSILPKKMHQFLNMLIDESKINKGRISNNTAGLIPVGGVLNTVPAPNVMLTGDAAGFTDPVTGAGILQAVVCGKKAGDVAAKAIRNDDLTILKQYESEWKQLLGKSLEKAMGKREYLDSHWDDEDLLNSLKKTWVAFRGYWSE